MFAFNAYNDVSHQTIYSSFFLLGNLLLCNCKYENLMIKSQSEPNQSYSPWGALSTMSSKTAPIIVSFIVVCNEGVLIMVIGLGGVQFRLVQSQVWLKTELDNTMSCYQ